MNSFKDFFYNKNDIVVAIVILLLAATIIYFRINAIMDYPTVIAEGQKQHDQTSTQLEPTKPNP